MKTVGEILAEAGTSWDDYVYLRLTMKQILPGFSSFTIPWATSSLFFNQDLVVLSGTRTFIVVLCSSLEMFWAPNVARIFLKFQAYIDFS